MDLSFFAIKAFFGEEDGNIEDCTQETEDAVSSVIHSNVAKSLVDREFNLEFLSDNTEEKVMEVVKIVSGLFPSSCFHLDIYGNILKFRNKKLTWS